MIAAAFATVTVDAADPERALSQYVRDRWETGTGFPGGPVYAITQTVDGYLWIAAEKGIVRFDGLNYRLFHPADLASGNDSAALKLVPDPQGGLWAWLRRASLLRFRNGAFVDAIPSPGPPNSRVSAMSSGNDGAILIADMSRGVIVAHAGRLDTVVASSAMPGSFVTSIAQTPNGDLWLGTRDSGLLHVQGGQAIRVTDGRPNQKINCLVADEHDEVWIGTDSGVFRWNARGATWTSVAPALDGVRAVAMIKDRDANVWIGTPDSLLRVNASGVTSLDRRLAASGVTTLFEDREGNLWIGTSSGIERWRDGAFTSYPDGRTGAAGNAGPIFIDAADRVWFAPSSGGLSWLRDGRVGRVASVSDDVIYSIGGSGDDLWIGRQNSGLTHVRTRGDTFTTETFTQADGLAQNQVFAVHRARDGGVWAGTLSAGASRLEHGAFTTYTMADGLPSNTVASVLEAADGTVWFATPNGASAKSASGWRRYSTADGLPSNDVNTLFEDSAHNVWVGTAAGLAVVRDGRVQSRRMLPAPLRASILGVAEDRAGWLWIACADRVLRVDRERLLLGSLGDEGVREFGAADGLLSVEAVKRHRSLMTDSRGRIWVSTNGGLAMADPLRLAGRAVPALVHVEDVLADGSPVDRTGEVRIPPRRNRITLAFAALSLSVPDRVRFRYRLDGFDRDWSDPVSAREAVYTNLDPGTYRFRVIASNSDGAWNSAEAALPFTIEPAWWQSAWFWLLAALLLTGGIWSGYRVRVAQVGRQLNVRFEERLGERTRIARELHDTLLQSFQGALLRFRAVSYLLPDRPADARATLEGAIDQARQAIIEGRDAVQGLRSPAGETHDLPRAIGTLGAALSADHADQKAPDFRVNVEGTPRSLPLLLRDEVYKIAGEALRNAFRHAHAARIEVEIQYDPRQFRLRVRDDGRGMDSHVVGGHSPAGHYGLAGMHERASLVGGTLTVWSERDSGTEVELTVPASVAYARSPVPGPSDLSRAGT